MERAGGYILLAGGAEFGGRMREVDQRAFTLAGGYESALAIIPAAAAPDNNHRRAGDNGVRWFTGLGGRNVFVLPVIDSNSAADYKNVAQLRRARFIYLLGGFPKYLWQTLDATPAWDAILHANHKGAVIGGSSAGAMVLCEYFYDPHTGQVHKGLDLLHNACILPHHNTFGKRWVEKLGNLLHGVQLIGIDEGTGMLDDIVADDGGREWRVYGVGAVTLYRAGKVHIFKQDNTFKLD